MTEVDKQIAYAMWRFDLWMKGYGSYNKIDNDVSEGTLIPGVYPVGFEKELPKEGQ
jgi:hypothetical protein